MKPSRRRSAWSAHGANCQPRFMRRSDFHAIKQLEKSAREQVACLLGMNMGFRTGEVVMCRFEHFDVDKGLLYVLDSKDHQFYPLPLDREVAYAVLAIDESQRRGYVLTHHPRFSKWTGQPITERLYGYRVKQWARDVGALDHRVFTPTLFRAFFAKEWMRPRVVDGTVVVGDITLLSKMMRHRQVFTTWIYLSKFTYVEDLQREMEKSYKPFTVAETQRLLNTPGIDAKWEPLVF